MTKITDKTDNIMLHFCFLEAPETETSSFTEKPIRKRFSFSLEETGLTFEQAKSLCLELVNHKTIAAWITGGSVKKVNEEESELWERR